MEEGRCHGAAGSVSAALASSPSGCQFVSPLFHFQSSSLLMPWERSRRRPRAWAPGATWRSGWSSGCWLYPKLAQVIRSFREASLSFSLSTCFWLFFLDSFSLSLSYCFSNNDNSNKPEKKVKEKKRKREEKKWKRKDKKREKEKKNPWKKQYTSDFCKSFKTLKDTT